jgi:hypothetical protein
MVRVDENITVAVDKEGDPIGFLWRNGSYLVADKPIRWFARREWWVEAARVQRGIGAGVLEVEMWRLMAIEASAKRKNQYELLHFTIDNTWSLVRVYS